MESDAKAVVATAYDAIGKGDGETFVGLLADDVVLIELTCTSESGGPVVAPVLEHWVVRDGKITQAKPYYHSVVALSRELAG